MINGLQIESFQEVLYSLLILCKKILIIYIINQYNVIIEC